MVTNGTKESGFTPQEVKLIRQLVPPGTTEAEVERLLHIARKLGLDPVLEQIRLVKRRRKDPHTGQWETYCTVLVGRDAYRIAALRSGVYDGHKVEPVFDERTGELIGARCTIWRKDCSHPIEPPMVFLDEYIDRDDKGNARGMWREGTEGGKRITMICKVAENQGLRMAFPDLSGTYGEEEFRTTADDQPIKSAQERKPPAEPTVEPTGEEPTGDEEEERRKPETKRVRSFAVTIGGKETKTAGLTAETGNKILEACKTPAGKLIVDGFLSRLGLKGIVFLTETEGREVLSMISQVSQGQAEKPPARKREKSGGNAAEWQAANKYFWSAVGSIDLSPFGVSAQKRNDGARAYLLGALDIQTMHDASPQDLRDVADTLKKMGEQDPALLADMLTPYVEPAADEGTTTGGQQ